MARSVKELQAWAELLELCGDDCQVFSTTQEMRSAVLEVELELTRLHKMEDCAIRLARMLKAIDDCDNTDEEWEVAMDRFWVEEKVICGTIQVLVPEAFTPEATTQDEEPSP